MATHHAANPSSRLILSYPILSFQSVSDLLDSHAISVTFSAHSPELDRSIRHYEA